MRTRTNASDANKQFLVYEDYYSEHFKVCSGVNEVAEAIVEFRTEYNIDNDDIHVYELGRKRRHKMSFSLEDAECDD